MPTFSPDDYDYTTNDSDGEKQAQANYFADPTAFQDPESSAINNAVLDRVQNGNAGGFDGSLSPIQDPAQRAYAATVAALEGAKKSDVSQDLIHQILTSGKDLFGKSIDYLNSKDAMKSPLMLMGLMGLSSAQNHAYQREAAQTQQDYAKERAQQQADIAKAIVDRNDAGIAAIQRPKGIIQTALTRIDGTPVFNSNGTARR